NALFEDNAEFGLGFKLSVEQHKQRISRLLAHLAPQLPTSLIEALQDDERPIVEKRQLITKLRELLPTIDGREAKILNQDLDYLVDKSVWIIGGDGWAYDIGYSGLDHVLSLTENVNILVLDTQCYSNTGGQQSKATPAGAVSKFADLGKRKA